MGWIIALLVLVLLYIFLIAPRMIGKPNRMPLSNVHYAHRGLFDNETYAPENSIAAIQKAIEAGYGIEFDVQLSKDNVPVVFHDASLKRMCGVDGKVWEYTIEELQKLKLGKSNETIPTLAHVLEMIDGQVPLIIEYKMDRVNAMVCELGNELLEKYKGVYCIESFHPLAVLWYRKHRPDVIRGQLTEDYFRYPQSKLPAIVKFVMKHQMLNFWTKPDFIAYRFSDRETFSNLICRKLWKIQGVTWTLTDQQQFDKAVEENWIPIFEGFMPEP